MKLAVEKALIEKGKVEDELKLKKMAHEFQMEILENQSELRDNGELIVTNESYTKPRGVKMPAYEDGKDQMDSYLRRFEMYAEAQ